ncbi:TIM-barrel domain-containing protein [Vibrio mediterranei]|uniref:glycoside hydrolase family 31 protein n=2 Tax=Vibrio mediterranei TaxID=689 RepID=UPI002283F8C5|nr:TIM-barrel domain-containing protein [Vibrio mediterranei]MCY9852056.1 DUF4968 domain-containing protein [Vibrio mediterranei]
MKTTNKLISVNKENDWFSIQTESIALRMYFLSDDIIRLRADFTEKYEEASYILTMTGWDDKLDSLLGNERQRIELLEPEFVENKTHYAIKTASLTVKLFKDPFVVKIYNQDGKVIYSDLPNRAIQQDHLGRVYHYSETRDERYFGFGETTGNINKKGEHISISPKDAINHDPSKTKNMYKHIPFYMRVDNESHHALGMFYHNSWESEFHMDSEVSGYWPRYSYFRAEGGDIDVFFINGPKVTDVLERYTQLTGKPYMPPKYSMGYLGSTMYYPELPQDCDDAILGFMEQNDREQIPISGFQLSSGYTVGPDNKRYVFTWNQKRFPEPSRFFKAMEERGCPVSPNIKPGILVTHPYYDEYASNNGFIKTADSENPYTDSWWGGMGSFVDFTHPDGRRVWKDQMKRSLIDHGVTSIWNDNCEYEINDRMATCHFDGLGGVAGELKAIQPTLMGKVAQEALAESAPNVRPYVINRSGSAGIQRYAQTWSGDNPSTWCAMQYGLKTIMGMGLSGVPNNGADVGGFAGPRPEKELFVRWVQSGVFYPRFSIHSCNTDNTVTEPWMYKDVTQLIRDAIQLRLSLSPYLYTWLRRSTQTGEPILRPLMVDFQNDTNVYDVEDQFMWGDSLLVAPVLEKGVKQKDVYLPAGQRWLRWGTHEVYQGGQTITLDVELDTIPMFIKQGGFVTSTSDINHLKLDQVETLKLHLAPATASYELYEDDGETNKFQQGEYKLSRFNVDSKDICTINVKAEGDYVSPIKMYEWHVISPEKGAFWCKLDGELIPQVLDRNHFADCEIGWIFDCADNTVRVRYPNLNKDHQLEVSFEKFDLIGMIEETEDE